MTNDYRRRVQNQRALSNSRCSGHTVRFKRTVCPGQNENLSRSHIKSAARRHSTTPTSQLFKFRPAASVMLEALRYTGPAIVLLLVAQRFACLHVIARFSLFIVINLRHRWTNTPWHARSGIVPKRSPPSSITQESKFCLSSPYVYVRPGYYFPRLLSGDAVQRKYKLIQQISCMVRKSRSRQHGH